MNEWKATKLCVAGGYSERDGIYKLVESDDKRAKQWFILVYVPPGADPRASGWVMGEGWLRRQAAEDAALDMLREHPGMIRVAPKVSPDARQIGPRVHTIELEAGQSPLGPPGSTAGAERIQ